MTEENIELIAEAARTVTANIGDYEPLEVIEIDDMRSFKDYEPGKD